MKGRYGKSMYGGWYLELLEVSWTDDTWKTFATLTELKKYSKDNNIKLVSRFDNI